MYDAVRNVYDAVSGENAAELENLSWWDKIVESFKTEWWAFLIGLAIVVGVLLLVWFLSRGKGIKFRRIVKIAINAVIGFMLLFIFNLVLSVFAAPIVANWYEWLIIGVAGIPGTILCIVFHFIWPKFW